MGPLQGIKVVEMGVWVAGPAAGGILAQAPELREAPPGPAENPLTRPETVLDQIRERAVGGADPTAGPGSERTGAIGCAYCEVRVLAILSSSEEPAVAGR